MTTGLDNSPLTEEEFALLALAGWHGAGGRAGAPPLLYFRHDDGRRVEWGRWEARAEVARIRALWAQVPALLRVAKAAQAVAWMVERYADDGGNYGPEMQDYEEFAAALAALKEVKL